MNQLDYQPAFTPGSFQHNQALAPAAYAGFQQQQQQQSLQQQNNPQQNFGGGQQFHPGQQVAAQNGMFNASSGQTSGPFTSAPFAQPVLATTQQQSNVSQSASPQQINSPFSQQQQQSQQVKYPMAAPPLPQTPSSATQQFSPLNVSTPATPQSPGTNQREQERIQLLLEINAELIEEITSLQTQGKGGAVNPRHAEELKSNNMDASMASEEYIQALRRVQANLSYMASKGNANNQAQNQAGPGIMSPPSHMPRINSKYERLKELFPGWQGGEPRAANAPRMAATPATNGMVTQ